MGIWDLVGSTAEVVIRFALVGSTVEAVKRSVKTDLTTPRRRRTAGNVIYAKYEKIHEEVEEEPKLTSTEEVEKEPKLTSTEEIEEEPKLTSTEEIEEETKLTSTEEVEEEPKLTSREGLNATAMTTNSCIHGSPVKSAANSYGFLTFAKIGYTFRVKVVYRIVRWMSDDGSKSTPTMCVTATDFAHESEDGNKLIPGQGVWTLVENECRNFYRFVSETFAKIAHNVRELMANPDAKSWIIMCIAILGENVRYHALLHGLTPPGGLGAAISIILLQTLFDIIIHEYMKPSREKAAGSQEFIPGVEMHDGKWYSAAYKFLKDKVGVYAMQEFLVFMVKEFSAFMRTAPFRTQFFLIEAFTKERLVLMMKKFFVFMKNRHCGAGFFIILEIVEAAVRKFWGNEFVNEWGFHRSATKGRKKKGKHIYIDVN